MKRHLTCSAMAEKVRRGSRPLDESQNPETKAVVVEHLKTKSYTWIIDKDSYAQSSPVPVIEVTVLFMLRSTVAAARVASQHNNTIHICSIWWQCCVLVAVPQRASEPCRVGDFQLAVLNSPMISSGK